MCVCVFVCVEEGEEQEEGEERRGEERVCVGRSVGLRGVTASDGP